MLSGLERPEARGIDGVTADDTNGVELNPRLVEELKALQAKNQKRGLLALCISFVVIAWFFSVPPDIRRSRICTGITKTQKQMESRLGCMRAEQLFDRIAEHYSTCSSQSGTPCVAFDFSIDHRTQNIVRDLLDPLADYIH